MSDTTALSHQYATHSRFVEQLNRWIGIVRNRRVAFAVQEDEVDMTPDAARSQLVAVLESVLARLSPGDEEIHDRFDIPEEVFQRIEMDHRGDRDWYIQDLNNVISSLRAGGMADDQTWKILDEIGDAADAVATASFRRLWRR
ncbi:hypothetical protein ACYOEI_04915 [Singulisphaera rosea]